MPVTTTPIVLPDGIDSLAGTYYTGTGIKQQLGLANLEVASNLDNDTTGPDLARIQADGLNADAYTTLRMTTGTKPMTAAALAADPVRLPIARLATNLYAAHLLVAHRIWFGADGPDEQTKRILGLRKRAEELLEMLFGTVSTGETELVSFGNVDLIYTGGGTCAGDEYANG